MTGTTESVNGGRAANRAGLTAEQIIATILTERHITYHRQHIIGQGIYGNAIRADFYISQIAQFPAGVAIESKWQDVSGSADEKLPYLVENIANCYPCPAIIVLDGGGHRDGAVAWVRARIDGRTLLAVMTLAEFITWSRRTLQT